MYTATIFRAWSPSALLSSIALQLQESCSYALKNIPTRPIPLNTPTEIELTPRLSIRVTLFDANHCTGAVMFLIEDDGKAILYTGDIRAESWWVNSLARNPLLVPYALGGKRLDKVYLDTTFARAQNLQHHFPSKAEGLAELLQKVGPYPEDTVFYFRAWTFGYEEVWMALSAALNAKDSIDPSASPAVATKYQLCAVLNLETGPSQVVSLTTKTRAFTAAMGRLQDGSQLPEVGIGGGAGDLYQVHELELPDQASLEKLEKLCLERIHDSRVLSQTRDALFEAFRSKSKSLSLDNYGMKDDTDIPLEKLVSILSRGHTDKRSSADVKDEAGNRLPNIIQFPYSRHSSYNELCELVSAFRPKDVYPCTTDPLTWDYGTSIRSLFGHLCSGDHFSHDTLMREAIANDEELLRSRKRARYDEGSSPQASQQSSFADSDFILSNSFASTQRHVKRPKPSTFPVKHSTKDFSSSSSSGGLLLPSSMEMIHETHVNTNPNEPLTVPEPTPETERAKRNEIRRAWSFLRSNMPGTSHLGPLPSSWPTKEDDGLQNKDINAINSDSKNKMIKETHLPPSTTPSPSPLPPNPDTMDLDTNTTHQTESQQTNPLSISESAFASFSSQDLEQEDDPKTTKTAESSTSRRRSRRAAYLAAQADTYEAWNTISLVSAGNNHTEPEIEL
ncbi:hypothetical protein SI65_01575 [Aspergillus cristatus]|uniref:Protein artemis n=1 Tax=Aspergillus cristatus TaxID=573508 RepID=A0A1E3BSS9_ASPCR|nr:hypothetical protein SI65_01575 [Aspergillus cristatus]